MNVYHEFQALAREKFMSVHQIQYKHPVICFRRGFFLPTNVQRKRKKERNHIFEAEASKLPSAEDETKIPIVWLLIRLQKIVKRDSVKASAWIWMFLFVITSSDFTLRSCMNDSHVQVFSLEKVVRRADYDLLILFLWKDRTKRHLFHYVGYGH